MDCSLHKEFKKEHAEMKNPKFSGVILTCPVIGKQICLWCCLHIADAADPMRRNRTTDQFPNFVANLPKLADRELDSIWETCSRCHVRA